MDKRTPTHLKTVIDHVNAACDALRAAQTAADGVLPGKTQSAITHLVLDTIAVLGPLRATYDGLIYPKATPAKPIAALAYTEDRA